MSDKPSEINISLSELIGIHRDRLHISQSELARRVGISRNYISLIERGHIENVSLKVLYLICHHLGLNVKIYYDEELASNGVVSSEGNLTMRAADGQYLCARCGHLLKSHAYVTLPYAYFHNFPVNVYPSQCVSCGIS